MTSHLNFDRITMVGAGLFSLACACSALAGPDVILSDIPGVASHGGVGGIRGYTLASGTCNIGDQGLPWVSNGTPGFTMNAYRLHDGRLLQIGLSWVKTACCAINANGCGIGCSGGSTSMLGAGCKDTYTAGWNSSQPDLAARSGIDAYGGSFAPATGGSGNAIFRRLQIAEADMSPTTYPNALYFVEGVYSATQDAQSHNANNNASYQRATFNSFNLALADSIKAKIPGIYAWRDYGNGIGQPDPSVTIMEIDVPNEGRFLVGSKVRDNGNGTWRYDYAVYNLNSHRSAGAFTVGAPAGVTVTDIGFHDVDYHSGEPYDNTDWSATREANKVIWSSPQTFGSNPNSNALRWGTMYNFWFTANQPPQEVRGVINMFRPGTPESVLFTVAGPQPFPTCAGDLAPVGGNGAVDVNDMLAIINAWGPCAGCPTDLNGDGNVNVNDLLMVVNAWGPCN